ncbi:MAG: glycosyltransferase family 4 protein [Ignavibacteria bacterium]
MKIRFLTQHFYPDTLSTGNLLTELAIGLTKKGYEIEVFTSQPHYDRSVVVPKFEVYHGIKIYRLVNLRFDKSKKLGRSFNYLSYFLKTLIKVLFSDSSDKYVYLIVSNPPFLPMVGVLNSIFRRGKFVHLLYDVHPEQAIAMNYINKDSVIVHLWQKINNIIYRHSEFIIVLCRQMKEYIETRLQSAGLPPESSQKITVIHNWADGNYIKPFDFESNRFIKEHNLQDKFLINYSGTLGVNQKFESLFTAADKLRDDNCTFLFIGDGVKKKTMQEQAEAMGLVNMKFFPYQDKSILPEALSASHLSVVHLEKEIEGLAMPSKLYTILASGRPILALCREGTDLAEIVRKADCGFVCQHSEVDKIVEVIKYLKSNPAEIVRMGQNARRYFESRFTFERALEAYFNVFEQFAK